MVLLHQLCQWAFRGSRRRLDESVTVRLQTPEEMMEDPPESDEDIEIDRGYYTELGHKGAETIEGVQPAFPWQSTGPMQRCLVDFSTLGRLVATSSSVQTWGQR